MQRETSFTEGLIPAVCSPIRSNNHRQSSSVQITSEIGINEENFNSMFPSQSSLFSTPCSSCNEENDSSATKNRLYLARLTLEYQELVDRYGLCLTHLQEASNEAEILRQDNATLQIANRDLMKRLSLLAENSLLQNHHRYLSSTTGYPSLSIINDFRSLRIGENNGRSNDAPVTSPTSVISTNNNRGVLDQKRGNGAERVSLPKSISIRSSGYLKMMNQNSVNNAAAAHRTNRIRVGTPAAINGTQQQSVNVENKDVGDQEPLAPLEFDVYNQGMFKTELCNKWQETGTCPYGEHCQFAHGIGELRPIIRHPRYKTEVCRMVLSGDTCPYGHRCHFRHALTEEERFMARAAGCGN